MAVKFEIKSQLAKLLATEDLIVEHKQVETAQFNVHTRVLILPLWEKASNVVYDMLVGHEVGHALFTPDRWDWMERVPQTFVNVCEDARIEKLIKRKYMGIAKSFYKAYNELQEKDFFEIDGEDIDNFNLADRANLYFKIGSFTSIPFSPPEKEIITLIENAETFDDTLSAAEALYNFCKKEQETESQVKQDEAQQDALDDMQGSGGLSDDSTDNNDSTVSESDTNAPMEDGGGSDDNNTGLDVDGDSLDEPEVKTLDSLQSKLKDLVDADGQENTYIEVPKVNLDTIIASNEDVHKVIDEDFEMQQVRLEETIKERREAGYPISRLEGRDIFGDCDEEFAKFKRSAQKEVNYLVKEFECKKSASAYARATTARTGVLDTRSLHTYKFNEDLFKKITVLPDGKNHGLVFILDWSGSMQYVLQDTCKQLFNLMWFCKKVQIPFEVYAFTNEWRIRTSDVNLSDKLTPHVDKAKEYDITVDESFSLMNLFTSRTNAKTLEHQMLNIWRLSSAFGRFHQTYFQYPPALCLSGTPLNESLVALHQIIPQFQKENKVEKAHCIVLTDGEANHLPYNKEVERYWEEKPFMGTRGVNPNHCVLRDRKLGKTYNFGYAWHEFTDTLLNNLKDRFPKVNFIGIRVVSNREAKSFIRRHEGYNEKLLNDWSKNKSCVITKSGYDAYIAMSSSNLADDTEFDVQEDATKAQIKRAFVKSLKVKKLNKKVLSEFISLVA